MVEYDHIETRAEFSDHGVEPVTNITEKCSAIWKIVPDTSEYHVSSRGDVGLSINCKYLKQADMNVSVILHLCENLAEDLFTICTMDDHMVHHSIRVKRVTLASA